MVIFIYSYIKIKIINKSFIKCLNKIYIFCQQDIITGNWVYRHADARPWDPRNDVVQYEHDYIIRTKTRHKTPIMRTGSIVSTDPQTQV